MKFKASKLKTSEKIANMRILALALVPHSSTCNDFNFCDKQPCFQWEPDKIIGKSYLVDIKTLEKINE